MGPGHKAITVDERFRFTVDEATLPNFPNFRNPLSWVWTILCSPQPGRTPTPAPLPRSSVDAQRWGMVAPLQHEPVHLFIFQRNGLGVRYHIRLALLDDVGMGQNHHDPGASSRRVGCQLLPVLGPLRPARVADHHLLVLVSHRRVVGSRPLWESWMPTHGHDCAVQNCREQHGRGAA